MTVDTLSISRDLKAAAMPAEQADAIAAAIGRSITDGSATKADLGIFRADFELVRTTLKGEIDLLRAETRGGFEALRTEIEKGRKQMIVWFVGTLFALGGLMIALTKL